MRAACCAAPRPAPPRPLLSEQELSNDPLGILRPASKLQHALPLASAYTAVGTCPDADHASLRQKRRLDPATGEPRWVPRHLRLAVGVL